MIYHHRNGKTIKCVEKNLLLSIHIQGYKRPYRSYPRAIQFKENNSLKVRLSPSDIIYLSWLPFPLPLNTSSQLTGHCWLVNASSSYPRSLLVANHGSYARSSHVANHGSYPRSSLVANHGSHLILQDSTSHVSNRICVDHVHGIKLFCCIVQWIWLISWPYQT